MSIMIAVLIFVRFFPRVLLCILQEQIAPSASFKQIQYDFLTHVSVLPLVRETGLVLLQCTPPELIDGSRKLTAKVRLVQMSAAPLSTDVCIRYPACGASRVY